MTIEEKLAAELARTWGHDVPPLDYRVIAKRLAPAVEQIALDFAIMEIRALAEKWWLESEDWYFDNMEGHRDWGGLSANEVYPIGFEKGWDHAGDLAHARADVLRDRKS